MSLPSPDDTSSDSPVSLDSPLTPSGSIPAYQKENFRKRRKKPGRSKGHVGESRRIPSQIDGTQEHTLHQCPCCQKPLGQPTRQRRRYIEDIPEEAVENVEHILNGYWCSHCKKIVEPVFTEAMPNANIGLRLYALTAWLHYLVGISLSNLVRMLNYFYGFRISTGGLVQGWQNLAELVRPEYETIAQNARESAVLNADETGWRLNGVTYWLWCFCNKSVCYYTIKRTRGSPVVLEFLGKFFGGTLICDFWGAYNKIESLAKQRCYFHLFSEMVKVDKYATSRGWAAFRKKLTRLLKDAIRLQKKKQTFDTETYQRRCKRLDQRLQQLIDAQYEDDDCKRLIKRLKRHQDEMFTFLAYDNVSPYNNHAEQQLRKPVLIRRISQQNRSETGAETQAILMSIFRTAELQKNNPVRHIIAVAQNAIKRVKLAA